MNATTTTMKTGLLGMAIASALLAGCGGGRGGGLTPDGGTNDAAQSAFAEWCASSGQNYANLTCTGSSEGDVCPGQIYCDACGRNVETRCVCEADASGFSFECDDPCASCESNGGEDGGVAQQDSSTPAPNLDACVVHYDGEMACLTLADTSTSTARSNLAELCEAQVDSDPAATLVATCPAGDAIGACALNVQGTLMDYIFYEPADLEATMENCAAIGIWRSF